MLSNILKVIFIYLPMIYGYWVFIFLVFLDVPQSKVEIQKNGDKIEVVELIK